MDYDDSSIFYLKLLHQFEKKKPNFSPKDYVFLAYAHKMCQLLIRCNMFINPKLKRREQPMMGIRYAKKKRKEKELYSTTRSILYSAM